MKIDVTMTATYRPELIEQTLESFFKNLFWEGGMDYRLIINVDPVGNDKDLSSEIKSVVSYFFETVVFIRPSKPSFPRAFISVWEQAAAPFVFHLEEDWVLDKKLSLTEMIEIMEGNNRLAHLRLNRFISTEEHVKCWNHFFHWNGEFYECKEQDKGSVGWCGHPSLNRLEFVTQVTPRLSPNLNPEKQIKGRAMGGVLTNWEFGIFSPCPCPSPCIRDIGRGWIEKSEWKKAGDNPQHFTVWERRR